MGQNESATSSLDGTWGEFVTRYQPFMGNRSAGGVIYLAESAGEVSGKSEGAGSLQIVAVQAAVR